MNEWVKKLSLRIILLCNILKELKRVNIMWLTNQVYERMNGRMDECVRITGWMNECHAK